MQLLYFSVIYVIDKPTNTLDRRHQYWSKQTKQPDLIKPGLAHIVFFDCFLDTLSYCDQFMMFILEIQVALCDLHKKDIIYGSMKTDKVVDPGTFRTCVNHIKPLGKIMGCV